MLNLTNTRRINLIVGTNGSGKSRLLSQMDSKESSGAFGQYLGESVKSFPKSLRETLLICGARFDARKSSVSLDDFGNGIHSEWLADVCELLSDWAKHFDVQLYVSTNNLELLNMFAKDFTDDVSYYNLQDAYDVSSENNDYFVHSSGQELLELIELMDADVRAYRPSASIR